jgi:general secretion pathway protein N
VKKALGVALVMALAAVATVIIRAPAAWLGDWLEARSKIRLIDPRGTVWQGSALVGMSDGRAITLVPGRVDWRIVALTPNSVAAELSHPWLTAPLRLSLGADGIGFTKGSSRIPAGVLASAGAPFNTLKPGGTLEISWTEAKLRGAAFTGEITIDWHQAKSALSTIAPLGSYRLRVRGSGEPPILELQTLTGPLQMQGSGRIEGTRVRFNGTATAEAGMRSSLDGLLGLLGMRSGDKVLLAIDSG